MEKISVDQFSALAHVGRLAVFRYLIQVGPDGAAAGRIASDVEVGPTTLSAQLTVLSNAGLVEGRRDGRSIIYTANAEAISALVLYLMQDCCGGRPDVCAPVLKALEMPEC